ncbi:oligosaccharide repeat unit polymerase [Maribellus sp. CM-23]|uniref:O-antigen polymerase n=1 Tax=Maribellus sp. CM-23 TaxID=2781026 RepID=UPI001F2B5601|nr:O-antigen polymerase [Maribellus sp. CM-23]MCE4566486.1 oligosaccharide repeat unit polymerase [Maribellus sp. CM-23]
MNNFIQNIEPIGILLFLVAAVILLYVILSAWLNRNRTIFWSPMTFIALTFLFYTIIGPYFMISNNDTKYAGIEMADYFVLSWTGALLSFLSILVSYKFTQKKTFGFNFKTNGKSTLYIGVIIFLIGFLSFIAFHDFNFYKVLMIFGSNTPNNGKIEGNSGYLGQIVDFCVAGVAIIQINVMKTQKLSHKLILVLTILLSVIVFVFAGARFRLIYLFITLISIYYLAKEKRPNPLFWLTVFISVVLIMGAISGSRSYQRGLDLSKIKDQEVSELIQLGLNDTRIFYSSGALISKTLKSKEYVPLEPFFTALTMPIPRSWWPDKPNAEYLKDANTKIWGTTDYGIAFMNYGDSFYTFGWLGIIFNGLFLGWLSKLFWLQFYKQSKNEYNLLNLALFNGFTYVMISRGYLAQELTMFIMFITIPMLLFKWLNIKHKIIF